VVVAALLGMAVLCVSVLWNVQRHLIYFPQGSPGGTAAGAVPGARDVTLTTMDGLELAGWCLPAAAGQPTVLVASGNAGHRGLRAPLAAALSRHGLGVLLFDYRGYGGNPGSPSEAGLARDVRAARSFLLKQAGVAQGDLLYLGESLGSAVVVDLAREYPPAGLVLRSPFTSLADVGRVHYPLLPVRALLRDRYPLAETIATVPVPTFVVLGTRDTIVPAEQSRAVARAAAGPTRVVEVEGADHNDPSLLAGDRLVGGVAALAREVTGSP
jgi:fermentation-respiration switch protein FrsA (DUF1100 family)